MSGQSTRSEDASYHLTSKKELAGNPNGYCGIGGTGVTCPIGLDAE